MTILLALLFAAPVQAQEAPTSTAAPHEAYQVGRGDVVAVKVAGEAAFSGRAVIGHDGAADFPFVGSLPAAGLTPDELRDRLADVLSTDYLVEPRVTVWVETYASQPVRVLGAVKSPGVYFLEGPTSISEMLARAGGVLEQDHVTEVQLRSEGEERTTVSLDRLLQDGASDLTLRRGDVLYLPAGEVVYLSGQVEKPGAVNMGEGLTVMQALTKAGGPNAAARLTGAYILRDGEQIAVNLRRIMRGKDSDVTLLPGDQVFVKQSVF